ncbi:hypothetical protein [Bacillus sp. FSL K6-3431]|uniref:hypothetical protein n=1 Tax=Bacillus sp. FSL K6-3431 TaxID=2921500 RepID=UPI0030F880D9
MSKQSELDAIFAKLATEYGRLNKRQQDFAIREIGRVRGELSDLLADYAATDGTIKRTRINRLLRDLDAIEAQIRRNGTVALDEIITESADWTTRKINGAMTTVIGSPAIAASSFDRVNRDVFRYVTKRFGDDDLVLSDRVWDLAGGIREEIATVLRSSIIRGEGVSAMIPQIRKVHENETWKIRRLAQTEGSTAYRTATAYNAERSKVVEWVQINDRPDGHRNHAVHRCYELAHADPYGQGAGIYKPTDSEIYAPHPNCTSFITYVLDERWL